MSKLPFAVEIAEARARSEDAHTASRLRQRVQAALQSVDIIRRQHALNTTIEPELPGDDLIDESIQHWPELGGIVAVGPEPHSPYLEQAERRRSQLLTIMRHIVPIAEDEHHRAHHLAHLQDDQQRALAAPEWAEITANLRRVGAERDTIALKLATSRQKVAQVQPLLVTVSAYLDRLQKGMPNVVNPEIRYHHRQTLVTDAIDSLESILAASQLEIAPLPARTAPFETIAQHLTELRHAIAAQLAELQASVDREQSQFDALTATLVAELG